MCVVPSIAVFVVNLSNVFIMLRLIIIIIIIITYSRDQMQPN